MKFLGKLGATALTGFVISSPLRAQELLDPAIADVANSGDTAWILTATALVLLTALPGLALFFGGRVRSKNILSVMLQILAVVAICSVAWVIVGYTLAFGPASNGFLGGGLNWMMLNLGNIREATFIPESTFAIFQMTFALFAVSLMIGAWAERARFGWVVAFSALWLLLVYAPVAHWLWGGGWLGGLGTLDFAGGIVVQTTAGVSALVAAIMVGKRVGWPKEPMLAHSPALTLAGAGLLWVGWFGLTGGSALTATDDASAAILNTHVAACVAALVWTAIDKFKSGKPTPVGIAMGVIAGLAAITPAAGFVGVGASIIIGAAAAIFCNLAIDLVKNGFRIDDSLNIFAVHGVGGMIGSLLLALFISDSFGGIGYSENMGFGSQFVAQLIGVGAVALYSAIVTFIIGFSISFILPMRVSESDEHKGLDAASHGETRVVIE